MFGVRGENFIQQSAALRGQLNFQGAIDLIANNIGSIDESIQINAWLECFRAAKEMGDYDQARGFAQQVALEDPKVPSIQRFL